jgi:hypothetical protein
LGGFIAVNTLFFLFAVIDPFPDAGIDGGLAVEIVDAGTVERLNAARVAPSDATAVDAVAGRLHGRVLAKGSRGSVPAAKIVATSSSDPALAGESDDDGRFDLPIPCGLYSVVVRAPGFEPLFIHHDACSDPAPLNLRVVPRPNLPIYETVVVAPHDEPSVTLQGPELVTTPGSLGDPLRTIESLPGVASVAWPAPIYAIRGSNPGNTGYFLDDVQVPLLFHLALGPSVIHPDFFDGMSFYPGGYPARYGRYVAGIVTSRRPRTECTQRPRFASTTPVVWFRCPGQMVRAVWPQPFAIPTRAPCSRFCAMTCTFPIGTTSCAPTDVWRRGV